MKIHVGVAVLAVGFGFVLQISSVEWIAVIICIGLVFSAEMINTALEILVDKVSPQKDPVAGKIKDISAGAVLIAAISLGLLILWDSVLTKKHKIYKKLVFLFGGLKKLV